MGYGALEADFRAAAAAEENRGLVHVLPAVPPTELLDWVASADVVGVLFQHDTLNNYLSTPNKFLEAMAAGVPIGLLRSPRHGADRARRPAAASRSTPPDIDGDRRRDPVDRGRAARASERRTRARALSAAHETYNWETQVQTLLDEYTRLTGRRW